MSRLRLVLVFLSLIAVSCGGGHRGGKGADFALSASSSPLDIIQGGSASIPLTVGAVGSGQTPAVTITVTGLPQGVTAAPLVIAAGETAATLNVGTTASTPQVAWTSLTITGTSAGFSHSTVVSLRVRGPSGSLDTTFGGPLNFVELGTNTDRGYTLAVQSDDKVLIGGYTLTSNGGRMVILRLTTAGELDQTFGTGGVALLGPSSTSSQVNSIALQPDGKILFAGDVNFEWALGRLNADGSYDAGFDFNGSFVTNVGSHFGSSSIFDSPKSIVVMPDGSVVAIGDTVDSPNIGYGAVSRSLPDGSLEGSYGNGAGFFRSQFASGRALFLSGTFDSAGRVVAAGSASTGLAVARLDSAGNFDSSFNGTGYLTTTAGTMSAAYAVAIESSGRIVTCGSKDNSDILLAAVTSSGTLDTTFGSSGFAIVDSGASESCAAIAIDASGKLVIAGSANTNNGDALVARYSPDGVSDPAFNGANAYQSYDGLGQADNIEAIAFDSQGRIVFVGTTTGGSNSDILFGRIWP